MKLLEIDLTSIVSHIRLPMIVIRQPGTFFRQQSLSKTAMKEEKTRQDMMSSQAGLASPPHENRLL